LILSTALTGSVTSSGVASPISKPARSLTPAAPETHCPSARKAVRFYSGRYFTHRARMGASTPQSHQTRAACSHVRDAAHIWKSRALVARQAAETIRVLRLRRLSNPTEAILHVFGPYGAEALRVASCESGRGVNASNGQYLGMFQMGSYARARYGHGYTPLVQAKAAYAYFVDSGRDWSPWSCKP
jgi:hypothetical protein